MGDDIVTRLRYAARACNHGLPNGAGDSFPDPTYCGGCLRLNDAADEIERLRAAGDALATEMALLINEHMLLTNVLRGDVRIPAERLRAVEAWRNARRG